VQFTVFTPVYNRRPTIHRVWESLLAQTCRDFEWVVVDDGSTDDGFERLREFQAQAEFPMRIERQDNGGKHVAWNRGVALAQGELFVPADSDDAFVPQALERFRALWLSIPEAERPAYSGVNVLCRDSRTGEIVGQSFPRSPMVSQNLELAYVHRVTGEKWGCIRTSVLRELPFPEDEALRRTYVAESYLWYSMARRYKALCVNEPLRVYYRDTDNSVMAARTAGRLVNRLGRHLPARYFFKSWHLNTNLDYLKRDRKELLKTLLEVWMSGLMTGASVAQVLRESRGLAPFLLLFASMPAGVVLYLYSRLRTREPVPVHRSV
jgi:glycosyltransferase involved in cell wall biosynthesis